MSGNAANGDEQFTGKYESAGAAANWLINRFFDGVSGLIGRLPSPPMTVLEIGCGAGFSTQRLQPMVRAGARFVASEFGGSLAVAAAARNIAVPIARESVYSLARADRSFDLVLLLEVLEHLDDPSAALTELARVCRGHVVLSTPREPLWCALNMARGKYLSRWGNTPGHLNHWSTGGLMRTVAPWFEVVDRRTPIPWSILLLRPRR